MTAAHQDRRPSPPEKRPAMPAPCTNPTMPTHSALRHLAKLSIHDEDNSDAPLEVRQPRPCNPRFSTDPMIPLSHSPQPVSGRSSPRNRSPYNRGHGKSASTNTPPAAPPMVRAHSSPPTCLTSSTLSPLRSTSPLRSPGRVRSPFRVPSEEEPSIVASPSAMYDIEVISEDSELDLTPRAIGGAERSSPSYLSPSPSPSPSLSLNSGNSFSSARRRRPASPLHQMSNSSFPGASAASSSASQSSPLFAPSRFNEAFPSELPLHHSRSFSSSSVPSTPTSARSRSPSISSLETIPDTPDAEAAAIEADRVEKLRTLSEGGESGGVRRGSLDIPGQRSGTGFGFTSRDKRKRWSVCGGEKRTDLDLETIWED